MIKQFYTVFKKELYAYFNSALGYILLAVYALISMLSTFYMGAFFNLGNSNFFSFFYFQTDTFVLLVPALTMRLWAEERKSGTVEFLLTQPVPFLSTVIAKFLAAWLMCLIMLLSMIPFWIYMNHYFELDNLNIFSGFLGAFMVAGAFCAVGCMVSSFNASPITSYMLTLFLTWGITVGNFSGLLKHTGMSNDISARILRSLNFDKHYYDFISGQISFDNLLYFFSIIFFALWLNLVSIEYKRN